MPVGLPVHSLGSHAPAALPPGKRDAVLIIEERVWSQVGLGEKKLSQQRGSDAESSSRRRVAIPPTIF